MDIFHLCSDTVIIVKIFSLQLLTYFTVFSWMESIFHIFILSNKGCVCMWSEKWSVRSFSCLSLVLLYLSVFRKSCKVQQLSIVHFSGRCQAFLRLIQQWLCSRDYRIWHHNGEEQTSIITDNETCILFSITFIQLIKTLIFCCQISDLYVENQLFGLTNTEALFLGSVPWDGILGLAFPSMSLEGGTPIFDNMWNQGKIPQYMFSMYLSRWGLIWVMNREIMLSQICFIFSYEMTINTYFIYLYTSSSVEGSMLILGGTDPSYYTGSISWIPLYQATNFWNIQMQR